MKIIKNKNYKRIKSEIEYLNSLSKNDRKEISKLRESLRTIKEIMKEATFKDEEKLDAIQKHFRGF